MSAVNVDQVLVDLATSLEATASTRYTDALNFMVPGSLAPTADTMKTYIFGSTSMAVNFASLIVTTIVLVKRLADLAADTSGSVQTTPYDFRVFYRRNRVQRLPVAVGKPGSPVQGG